MQLLNFYNRALLYLPEYYRIAHNVSKGSKWDLKRVIVYIYNTMVCLFCDENVKIIHGVFLESIIKRIFFYVFNFKTHTAVLTLWIL